jgi:hypothetical protein
MWSLRKLFLAFVHPGHTFMQRELYCSLSLSSNGDALQVDQREI